MNKILAKATKVGKHIFLLVVGKYCLTSSNLNIVLKGMQKGKMTKKNQREERAQA